MPHVLREQIHELIDELHEFFCEFAIFPHRAQVFEGEPSQADGCGGERHVPPDGVHHGGPNRSEDGVRGAPADLVRDVVLQAVELRWELEGVHGREGIVERALLLGVESTHLGRERLRFAGWVGLLGDLEGTLVAPDRCERLEGLAVSQRVFVPVAILGDIRGGDVSGRLLFDGWCRTNVAHTRSAASSSVGNAQGMRRRVRRRLCVAGRGVSRRARRHFAELGGVIY